MSGSRQNTERSSLDRSERLRELERLRSDCEALEEEAGLSQAMERGGLTRVAFRRFYIAFRSALIAHFVSGARSKVPADGTITVSFMRELGFVL